MPLGAPRWGLHRDHRRRHLGMVPVHHADDAAEASPADDAEKISTPGKIDGANVVQMTLYVTLPISWTYLGSPACSA